MSALEGYTVDEAIDHIGLGAFQLVIFCFCGLTWLGDAMELLILAILSPAVKCQWSLSAIEEAMITSVVFVGLLIGSVSWGYVGDNFGRKKAMVCTNLMMIAFAVLSSLKLTPNDAHYPGYPWLLVCRFGVGFAASGGVQATSYYVEFLPSKIRGVCSAILGIWWGAGVIFGAALAVGVMGYGGLSWHWYLGLSAIPTVFSLVLVPLIPESAFFLASKGRRNQALSVLRKVAWINCSNLPSGELLLPSIETEESSIDADRKEVKEDCEISRDLMEEREKCDFETCSEGSDFSSPRKGRTKTSHEISWLDIIWNRIENLLSLFLNGRWKTTLPLMFLWLGTACLYYGGVLLTTSMLQDNRQCRVRIPKSALNYVHVTQDHSGSNASNITSSGCYQLVTADYLKIMWTAAAEMPGLLLTIVIIEIIGRKLTLAMNLSLALLGYCLLFICASSTIMTFFFFIVRSSTSGLFQTIFTYTSEVYPTNIRGTGIGFASSIARIGAILTPYIAQVLFNINAYAAVGLYAGTCLVLAVISLLLPIEMKGKSLTV